MTTVGYLAVIPTVDGIENLDCDIDHIFWWKCKPCGKNRAGDDYDDYGVPGTEAHALEHAHRHGSRNLVACRVCGRNVGDGHSEQELSWRLRPKVPPPLHYMDGTFVALINNEPLVKTVDEAEVFLWMCTLCERENIPLTTREALTHAFDHYSSDAVRCMTCAGYVTVDHAVTHARRRNWGKIRG